MFGPQPGRAIKPVVLVEDNGPIHVSKLTLKAIEARKHWLTVEWLPKYAPELNDIEVVWHDLKARHLAHQTFADAHALDRAPRSRGCPEPGANHQSVGHSKNLCLVFELLPVDAFAAINLYDVGLYTPGAPKIFNSALACLEAVEIVDNDVTHRGYPVIKTIKRIHG